MKIKELINHLSAYNQNAEVKAVVNNETFQFSLNFSSFDGRTKKDADSVYFFVDKLCNSEKECEHEDIILHNNFILCRDCHEIIWQGLNNVSYPEKLKKKLKGGYE